MTSDRAKLDLYQQRVFRKPKYIGTMYYTSSSLMRPDKGSLVEYQGTYWKVRERYFAAGNDGEMAVLVTKWAEIKRENQ